MVTKARRTTVYLAYIDDPGTHGPSDVALFGAVIIPDGEFSFVEGMAGVAIDSLFAAGSGKVFKEFHARDLYLGKNDFEGIDEAGRLRKA